MTPTGYGYRKSCCSKHGSLRSSLITTASCDAFPRFTNWQRLENRRCSPPGADSDTTAGARMLHADAKKIVSQLQGKFPNSQKTLSELPGIGRYTSAAIASIAFGEPVAVVDGNVTRVIQRLLAKDIKGDQLWQIADQLLCRERAGDSNQALMELGATICLPKQPKCDICPVRQECTSRDSPGESPARSRQMKRKICYALDCRDGSVFLVKRPADCSLMPGMWELPQTINRGAARNLCMRLRHSITVTDFDVLVIRGPASGALSGKWVKTTRTGTLPLTGLTGKILRAAKII